MSRSTEHSRLRESRSHSRRPDVSRANSPFPTDIVFSEGVVSEETAELLHEFVHPHHQAEDTLIDQESDSGDEVEGEIQARSRLPWWKRPSPMWVLALMPFSSMAFSMTMAPRVEVYTQLACAVLNPDVFHDQAAGVLTYNVDHANADLHFSTHESTSYHNETLDFALNIAQDDGKTPGRPSCASDPAVQAAVAKLAATMAAIMGVLGCLTTAWWGSFSDRIGRTAVLGISVVGLLVTDLNFLVVYTFYDRLPGGYWFLVVGPVIEGSLGGLASAMAALHAYLADTTTRANRSRVFSLSLGLMFSGMGIGPTLGGLLIRVTGNILSVFYFTTLTHFVYAFLIWFIIPESLTQAQRRMSRVKHDHSIVVAREGQNKWTVWMKRIFGFLSPLSVFMPEVTAGTNPLKTSRRDWNLTLVAFAYGFTLTLIGSYTYKFQYAAAKYAWNSETIGYWLSLVGVTRALFLTLILPLVIKFFKARPPAEPKRSERETEGLLASDEADTVSMSELSDHSSSKSFHFERHSSAFDLALARVSLVVDMISYLLMALANHPIPFAAASVLGSFGTGFSPSLQSVALELYTQRGGTESGKLFGALSVVQAVSSQIIGPPLYGFVFVSTVSTFPTALFYMGVLSVFISFVFLACVRLPHPEHNVTTSDVEEHPEGHSGIAREATLVDVNEDIAPSNKVSPSDRAN
ncbi:MFS general substrate transporter [Hymenopellis radicata]|nr:MFS general substrate transporter [Hymenopellis radicata]